MCGGRLSGKSSIANMRIFFDTNVLMDVALRREPHFERSRKVLEDAIENHTCFLSWHTVSNLAYLVSKIESEKVALEFIENLTKSCRIAPVEHKDLKVAFEHHGNDFEDAMQIASALSVNADTIVSRDQTGFSQSPISITNPS